MAEPRFFDIDFGFQYGVRSDIDPVQLKPGYVWNAVNLIFRGGVVKTRPGFNCVISFPKGRPQLVTLFRAKSGGETCIVVIEGKIYIAQWPFTDFRLVEGFSLSPSAPQIYAVQAEQSVKRATKDFNSPIVFIEPRNLLILQDGVSPPLVFDGTRWAFATDDPYGVPMGTHMAFAGDRLWVARQDYVYASDICNPLSFRESDTLGNAYGFVMPGEVTAMAQLSSLETPELLVFTDSTCTMLRASIRDRSQWVSTANFQQELFKVGCVANRSLVSHYGQLYWLSKSGIVSLDAAQYSRHTSKIPLRDVELAVSKVDLNEDLSGVVGGAYGPYILFAVPYADVWNQHIWVLDTAGPDPSSVNSPAVWNGIWTGIRPVSIIYGHIGGRERIYALSYDYDETPRLWELFSPSNTDNGCPITWALETRGYFSPVSAANYPPFRLKKLAWFELQMVELSGKVFVSGWWGGATRGPYHRCLYKRIEATRASIVAGQTLTASSIVFNTKPQSRLIKSEDARFATPGLDSVCSVESEHVTFLDSEFQLLIVGSGDAGIRGLRIFAEPYSESVAGACEPSEENITVVKYGGHGAQGATAAEAVERLAAAGMDIWTSTKTVSLTQSDVTVFGTGTAESIISQEHADYLAQCIATKRAEFLLQQLLPPVIGMGYIEPAIENWSWDTGDWSADHSF